MNSILIKNVSFSYDEQTIFKNFNLSLSKYKTYSIMGEVGSGKSTLAKIIAGTVSYEGKVLINNANAKERVILVSEETKIKYINIEELRTNIKELLFYFKMEELESYSSKELSIKEKIEVSIIQALSFKKEVIILDNVFNYLNNSFKKNLIKYVKANNITLINIVSNEEDTLYTDYLIILYKKGLIAIEGTPLSVFKEEKLVRRLGFNLPFYVDLSIQLGLYGLLDDIYLSREAMVKNIWK